jgi:hypothetical protein
MTVGKLTSQLDSHIDAHKAAAANIRRVHQEIAELLCPFKVGETISVNDRGKIFTGLINDVSYISRPIQFMTFEPGAEHGWQVSGARLNKGTKAAGKWSFAINSLEFECDDQNTWIRMKTDLDDLLNAMRMS